MQQHDGDYGLSLPTIELMSLGGDDRITLDEQSGLNSYGCAPEPVRAISYSSSTASSISSAAFAHVHGVHYRLRQQVAKDGAVALYRRALRDARARIRACYGLDATVDIAFGASGTDLEYLSLALALLSGNPARNIVVEVDEVGSGCQFSQAGQYFAARTALGIAVEKGAQLPGFDAGRIAVETLHTRAPDGPVLAPQDYGALLEAAIARSIGNGERPLVHVVHRSKTGIIAPSLAVLDAAIDGCGGGFDIVVDACQGRISPATVRAYLARGATVFITGSKFIGGPPFSAFALVPAKLGERFRSHPAPAGLGHFFARAEMPAGWSGCDGVLPETANFGMLLRLEAGLFELERLLSISPDRLDMAISEFGAVMRDLPAGLPFRLADMSAAADLASARPHPLDRKMLHVIEITMPHPATGATLSFEEARAVYRMLYTDLSGRFADPADRLAAAEICHLGQPVKCLRAPSGDWAPTLRMALSAPQIADYLGLDEGRLEARFRADIARIADKMRLAIGLLAT